MHSINGRGTYMLSHKCVPHLLESKDAGRDPHILNNSPVTSHPLLNILTFNFSLLISAANGSKTTLLTQSRKWTCLFALTEWLASSKVTLPSTASGHELLFGYVMSVLKWAFFASFCRSFPVFAGLDLSGESNSDQSWSGLGDHGRPTGQSLPFLTCPGRSWLLRQTEFTALCPVLVAPGAVYVILGRC